MLLTWPRHPWKGPSPRGRGSRPARSALPPGARSIPAWAGKPRKSRSPKYRSWVHPRVGGEAAWLVPALAVVVGPSPRGRGSLYQLARRSARRRSIPAWAGKPAPASARSRAKRVHPRVGGEAAGLAFASVLRAGPSPRGRGSLDSARAAHLNDGSIPAWAGKPRSERCPPASTRVHPRVGGEAVDDHAQRHVLQGPSPRGRGSPSIRTGSLSPIGSIPAWAGKPQRRERRSRYHQVHPRVGGEAIAVSFCVSAVEGPSPRGRGSPDAGEHVHATSGSIPAWAGKPWASTSPIGASGVHPRVGGEAVKMPVVTSSV